MSAVTRQICACVRSPVHNYMEILWILSLSFAYFARRGESIVIHYIVKNCVETQILHPHLIVECLIPVAWTWLHGSVPIEPEDLKL